jgi:hypothetical protein
MFGAFSRAGSIPRNSKEIAAYPVQVASSVLDGVMVFRASSAVSSARRMSVSPQGGVAWEELGVQSFRDDVAVRRESRRAFAHAGYAGDNP